MKSHISKNLVGLILGPLLAALDDASVGLDDDVLVDLVGLFDTKTTKHY